MRLFFFKRVFRLVSQDKSTNEVCIGFNYHTSNNGHVRFYTLTIACVLNKDKINTRSKYANWGNTTIRLSRRYAYLSRPVFVAEPSTKCSIVVREAYSIKALATSAPSSITSLHCIYYPSPKNTPKEKTGDKRLNYVNCHKMKITNMQKKSLSPLKCSVRIYMGSRLILC